MEKLTPPSVPFSEMGLYWVLGPEADFVEPDEVLVASPGRVAELQAGWWTRD